MQRRHVHRCTPQFCITERSGTEKEEQAMQITNSATERCPCHTPTVHSCQASCQRGGFGSGGIHHLGLIETDSPPLNSCESTWYNRISGSNPTMLIVKFATERRQRYFLECLDTDWRPVFSRGAEAWYTSSRRTAYLHMQVTELALRYFKRGDA